jgi:hypothetical protein
MRTPPKRNIPRGAQLEIIDGKLVAETARLAAEPKRLPSQSDFDSPRLAVDFLDAVEIMLIDLSLEGGNLESAQFTGRLKYGVYERWASSCSE